MAGVWKGFPYRVGLMRPCALAGRSGRCFSAQAASNFGRLARLRAAIARMKLPTHAQRRDTGGRNCRRHQQPSGDDRHAVVRSVRFDLKVALPVHDAKGLFAAFRHRLPNWHEADLRDIAIPRVGSSAADVDAATRLTQAIARAQRRDTTPNNPCDIFHIAHDPAKRRALSTL